MLGDKKHVRRSKTRRILGHEPLELRCMLSGSPYQNPLMCNDLNDDGSVSPTDALMAINAINAGTAGSLASHMSAPTTSGSTSDYLDANGDGSLSPADALSVINAINDGNSDDSSDSDDVPTGDQQPGTIGADAPTIALTNGFGRAMAELNTDGDVDVFQVAATAGQLNVALFTRAGDMTVSIEDANGNVVGTTSTADAVAHHPAATTVAVTAGSTYYLVVSGGSGVTGEYCLQVINSDTIPAPPAPGGDDSGDDNGDGDDDTGDPSNNPPPTPADVFAKLDTNSDGSLSLDEFEALPPPKDAQQTPEQVFAKLDADQSGSLSLDEFAVLFAKPDGQPGDHQGPGPGGSHSGGGQNGGGGPSGGGGSGGSGPTAPPTPEQVFTHFDANSDGSLSLTEFEALSASKGTKDQIDQVFATWDTDSSGLLSLTEFEAGTATLPHR